ncbi:beta-L-arabinofuranosidase domain-containing protein [Chitinophaga defluvii]|uniref:Beta-L-arabinofuranosidase domain-containing protein n=1 Tax=Chitinophaga defluvii TaxID=3163343 RepID=A0ABV2T282_9BACT
MKYILSLAMVVMVTQVCAQRSTVPPRDLLRSNSGTAVIKGFIGDKISKCISNRVMVQEGEKILHPFAQRTEKDFNDWRCEYWGKWFTSAALAYLYQPGDVYKHTLDASVTSLLRTQGTDGYIGTYSKGAALQGWDVWGRKYVLLGLLSYYDLTKDNLVLRAAARHADNLIAELKDKQIKITDNGLDAIDGLSSNSILEPMVLLYQRTGNKKYLDFANEMIKAWGRPGKFTKNGLQLVEKGNKEVPPIDIAAPKAYEMMSCYEGLCEMYRATGDTSYLLAVLGFAHSVLKNERMIVGSASNQELWSDGVRQQTEIMQQPMETCVTITWMKLCYQLLRLTGDSKWADELELSLYNALAGAQTPDGSWWSYFSPLNGERVPSTAQHNDVGLSCCVANGPRGLLLTPSWAVMSSAGGLFINLYAPAEYSEKVNGTRVLLTVNSDYPVTEKIEITVSPDKTDSFTLALRIPSWSTNGRLSVNGEWQTFKPGTYCKINRKWKVNDKVVFYPDLRGRLIPAPSGAPQIAVMRGPVVLAIDNRMVTPADDAVWLLPKPWNFENTALAPAGYKGYVLAGHGLTPENKQAYIDLEPVTDKPDDVWMAFNASFLIRPSHFFNHAERKLVLCDYASAGNRFSADNLFRVWLPQPLFLSNAFVKDTWKITYPDKTIRPEAPSN